MHRELFDAIRSVPSATQSGAGLTDMDSKRAIAALLFTQMIAGVAMAQGTTSEFSRVSGGQIELLAKQTRRLSGSLGITMSRSGNRLRGYEATLGGTIVEDRLWFFGAAHQSERLQFASTLRETAPPLTASTFDGKLNAQLSDRHSLAASFSTGRNLLVTPPATNADPLPSSFLSLHYTGIVSNNLFFTGSFLKRSGQPR